MKKKTYLINKKILMLEVNITDKMRIPQNCVKLWDYDFYAKSCDGKQAINNQKIK